LRALEVHNGKVLEEDQVQAMVDEIYAGKLGTLLVNDLKRRIDEFSRDVLSTCRPFSSDDRVEDLFEEIFDGFEVLPRSLSGEYERRLEEAPLLAPGLLIPVTRGQYFSLRSRGRLQQSERVMIADCPYSEMGLEVYGPPSQDGV
jgi:hypothetical protein